MTYLNSGSVMVYTRVVLKSHNKL